MSRADAHQRNGDLGGLPTGVEALQLEETIADDSDHLLGNAGSRTDPRIRRSTLHSGGLQRTLRLAPPGWHLLLGVGLLAVTLALLKAAMPSKGVKPLFTVQWPRGAEKLGAGLLVTLKVNDTTHVLLLLRRSKHNDNTWGLPGGNVDPEDTSLRAAAEREAHEELGHLPEGIQVLGEVVTRRGKHNSKYYTVIVARAPAEQRQLYTPELNLEEHREWRWIPAGDVVAGSLPLHPVVALLFRDPRYTPGVNKMLGMSLLPPSAQPSAVGTVQGSLQLAPGVPASPPDLPASAEKIGAGIFIMTNMDGALHALLLKRNSKHNDNTWGLPGGNAEDGENMAEAAEREAREEIGSYPALAVLDYILTRWG